MTTCRLLLSVWVASLTIGCSGIEEEKSPPPVACTLIGCTSGANYEGDFSLNGADPNSLEITACFNGSCSTGPIRSNGSGFSCGGEMRDLCWLSQRAADSLHLRLTVSPPAGVVSTSLRDGDRYEARIGVPGQAPLLKLDATATYTISQPNGPQCGPLCKTTQLLPSP